MSADHKIDIHGLNPFVRETRRVSLVAVSGFS